MICQICNTENPANSRFCGNCGNRLGLPVVAPAGPAALDREGGERRRLFVLFADVVSSTQIAGQLDPEEWRDLLSDYQDAVTKVISAFDGHVAKYLGDGVLAYFGWPVVHENDGERAARAGLSIIERVVALNRSSAAAGRPSLGTRVGIHVGQVVITPSGEIYGEAANVAAHVQGLAEIDHVVVTEAVFRAIGRRLALRDLGTHQVKGPAEPVRLYRVVSSVSQLGRAGAPPPTPFVDRFAELRTMLEAWDVVRNGGGRLLAVTGEAGIGKSRLVREFGARIAGEPHTWLMTGGSDIFRGTPFYPIIGLLNRLIGRRDAARTGHWQERLLNLIRQSGLDADQLLPLAVRLLDSERSDDRTVNPADQRARLLEFLVTWTVETARRRPTVLVIEDLHWIDPSTLEALEALVEVSADVPLLLVVTARTEFRAPWPVLSHHSHIVLGRLGRGDIREIARGAGNVEFMLDHLLNSIAERAAGIPLFAEELARLIEARGASGDGTAIPETLAASLTARLDQLGPAREIAQIGAVIGEEFDPDLLAVVTGRDADALVPEFDHLMRAGILARRLHGSEQVFAFRHALLRDAAYETLLRSRRRQLHQRVGEALVERFPVVAQAHPEIVARHFSAAGQHERAASAWQRAGLSASERGAYREAEDSYSKALTETESLPESHERDVQRLHVQSALAVVLQVTRGYSATPTTEAGERAGELSARVGNADLSLDQLGRKWAALSSAGKYADARDVADQCMAAARREGHPERLAGGHMMQMTSHYRLGQLVEAERHFLAGEALFANEKFIRYPGAVAQTFGNASRNAWMLGRPDEARRRMDHALRTAVALNSPYDTAFAEYMGAILAVLMRDGPRALQLAESSMELADRNSFPQFAAISRIALGRALVGTNRSSEAIGLIEQGIAGMTETGSRVAITLYLAWLAEAQFATGEPNSALGSIDRAFDLNPEELFFRPELLRIRGEVRFAARDIARAEDDLRAAVTTAAEMNALGLELRAAMALYKHFARGATDRQSDVAVVYRKFAEGFDTADLIDAAALTRSPDRP